MSAMTKDRNVEMYKLFNLKKLALRVEYCIVGIPHNTVQTRKIPKSIFMLNIKSVIPFYLVISHTSMFQAYPQR